MDGSHMAHERGRRRILEGERERERKEGRGVRGKEVEKVQGRTTIVQRREDDMDALAPARSDAPGPREPSRMHEEESYSPLIVFAHCTVPATRSAT